MGIFESRIQTWDHFLRFVEALDAGLALSYKYAFRGHSEARRRLQPTLLRTLQAREGVTASQAIRLERRALEEFRGQAHLHLGANELSTTRGTMGWWSLMQHHGAPTRLLDWTASPYVAAYFAAIESPSEDGAVWAVHMESLHKSMRERYQYSHIPTAEKAFSEEFLKPDEPMILVFARRRSLTDRMVAQQGMVGVCRNILGDHEDILDDSLQGTEAKTLLAKLILPAELKLVFLRKLRAMNITASSLFPGLDGLAGSVGELVRLGLSS